MRAGAAGAALHVAALLWCVLRCTHLNQRRAHVHKTRLPRNADDVEIKKA